MIKDLLSVPKDCIRNRKLIWRLMKNDFKKRYAGSYLGIIWAMIQPIITVVVYWFVFEIGLPANAVYAKQGLEIPFVLWLTAGLVPWFYFSEALSNGTNALLEYNFLVKKVVFDIDILPVVKVGSAIFIHAFFICFMMVLNICYGRMPDLYTLQIIYYSFAMIVFVLALCYLTSALVIFFRDLTQIVAIFLQVGVWMTPIMWQMNRLDRFPALQKVFKLNPIYYVVNGYRDSLFDKVFFWEHGILTLYFWAVTFVIMFVGVRIFTKLKVHFADVL